MRYASLITTECYNGPGWGVTFALQGCPHHCHGCFNPETWDFQGGREFTPDVLDKIIKGLTAQGIKRNFCIMGGEPLCPENQFLTLLLVNSVKERLPDTKIYIWTGYKLDEILNEGKVGQILEKTDVVIDGPYIAAYKDRTLFMRGSSNQRILYKGKDF